MSTLFSCMPAAKKRVPDPSTDGCGHHVVDGIELSTLVRADSPLKH